MTALTFGLRISMTSDWHIGSGKGRHRSIDSLVDKDADGLPYVSASTIRGIWRDAAQLLASALDAGPPSSTAWSELADTLFGSEPTQQDLAGNAVSAAPSQSLMRLEDAGLSPGIRLHLTGGSAGRAALRDALTFIRPGIEIDPLSGRTKTDFLRFEQVSRRSLVFAAGGTVDLGNAQCSEIDQRVIAAFLVAAAALVERLGGKRRRGLGRCNWTMTFPSEDFLHDGAAAADILEEALQDGGVPRLLSLRKREPQTFAVDAGKTEWTIYRLAITTHAPVIVADEVQGNVITSQDSIPGTYLLGYVGQNLQGVVPEFWQHLAAGDVRVLPAYPDCNGERGLPLPLVWSLPKNKSDGIALQMIARGEDKLPYPMKPVRQGFVTGHDPMWWLPATKKSFKTHNTVLDETQRPDEEVGGVYTYEAIAASQVLHAEVRVRRSLAGHDRLATCLTDKTTLGRARHAGYGRVSIAASLYPTRDTPRTSEAGKLRLWLTSDAIVNAAAASGRDATRALQDAVADTLNMNVEDLFVTEDSPANWVNVRWRRVESWQTQWGLPRPTLMALQAGSVAELVLKPGVQVDIALLEREGIGARRGEGYGAVCVDHPLLSCAPSHKIAKSREPDESPPASLTPDDCKMLGQLHRRAWERWIVAAAETLMASQGNRTSVLGWMVAKTAKAVPPMSQIGGLRAAMGTLADQPELERVQAWATHLAAVPNRKNAWGDALGKLRALISAPGDVWTHFLPGDEAKLIERGLTPPPESWDGFNWRTDEELQRLAIYSLLAHAARFHKRALEAAELPLPETAQ